jgi:hypothetical protein
MERALAAFEVCCQYGGVAGVARLAKKVVDGIDPSRMADPRSANFERMVLHRFADKFSEVSL